MDEHISSWSLEQGESGGDVLVQEGQHRFQTPFDASCGEKMGDLEAATSEPSPRTIREGNMLKVAVKMGANFLQTSS